LAEQWTTEPRYNRREPVDCRAMGYAKKAWFYVNEGSITVVFDCGGQARITRQQLLKALHAMRPRGKGVDYVRS